MKEKKGEKDKRRLRIRKKDKQRGSQDVTRKTKSEKR